MTVELINTLSTAAFIAAGVMFLLAIALFFILDIPMVVGELSGKNAKKTIKEIQKHNEGNSERLNRVSSRNTHVTKPGKTGRVGVGTEKFATNSLPSKANETTLLNSNETTLLNNNNETTLLNNNENTQPNNNAVNMYNSNVSTQVTVISANNTVVNSEFAVVETLESALDDTIIE
jgi:hypothetical protein